MHAGVAQVLSRRGCFGNGCASSSQLRMQSAMETTALPDSPARLRALLRAVLRLISQEREKWQIKLRALGCWPPARTPVEYEAAGDDVKNENNPAALRQAIQEAVKHWEQEKGTLEAAMRSSCVAEAADNRAKHTKPAAATERVERPAGAADDWKQARQTQSLGELYFELVKPSTAAEHAVPATAAAKEKPTRPRKRKATQQIHKPTAKMSQDKLEQLTPTPRGGHPRGTATTAAACSADPSARRSTAEPGTQPGAKAMPVVVIETPVERLQQTLGYSHDGLKQWAERRQQEKSLDQMHWQIMSAWHEEEAQRPSSADVHRVLRLSSRYTIRERAVWFAIGVVAALIVAVGVSFISDGDSGSVPAPSMREIVELRAGQLTEKARLLREMERMFENRLEWIAETDGRVLLEIQQEDLSGGAHESSGVAVRVVVVQRNADQPQWTPVWAVDLVAREERVIRLTP